MYIYIVLVPVSGDCVPVSGDRSLRKRRLYNAIRIRLSPTILAVWRRRRNRRL